ncbi:MAG TPA: Do family serine endopeptidase [Steroidobacteraceae bacterium]|nr:Do family serine endopeptidase [Steroidobacteraceae bacterium]
MTFSRSARGAAFAVVASVTFGILQGVCLAQAAPPARAAEPLPAITMPDFSALVERYGPAVVNVEVVERPQAAGRGGPDADDPLNDFFRRFGIPNQGGQQRNTPPAHGTGSGFIVSQDGYILTNAHVVSAAETVTVKLTDRREFQAKVVGQDERTDVAVIKIDAKDLPVVKIGDPRQLKPGQWVVAIGSPFNFDNTATAGIVSATARSLPNDNSVVPFIQTDVAVNPGNSGGPLFNTRGEVVGINSQIFSQTGSYMGLSFAIPIDIAVNVENQLIKTGHVVRGRIGVSIQDVNAAFAESFGLGRPRGALVSSVEAGGPAEKAGIKPGDVILGVNGQTIDHYGELSLLISNMHVGSDARLSVWRDRKAQDIMVKIALVSDDATEKTAANRTPKGPSSGQAERLGLTVRALGADEKQQAQTDGTLVVESVAGPAAAAGVQAGDIILGVNGKAVHSTAELQAAAKTAGKTVALLIQRQDQQIFVPLRLN